MKLLIRADSNKTVAMGHVMRCLSLADGFKKQGGEVVFVVASDDPKELIESRGYGCRVMNTDFSVTSEELDCFIPMIEEEKPDIILCDGYYFSNEYFEKIAGDYKLAYIDDYGLNSYPVDLLVNYNIYGPDTDYESLYKMNNVRLPKLLLGPDYSMLRQAFLDSEPIEIKRDGGLNILLSTGGADLCCVSKEIADRYLANPIENTSLGILVGPFNKDRDYLKKLSAENPELIKIYENITDMPAFLKKFDLAISAAGSTTYELCKMGVPTCLFCSVDNQSRINETFSKKGICESAGTAEKDKEGVINRLLCFADTYSKSYELRFECAERMKKTVDGLGADRITQAIIEIA